MKFLFLPYACAEKFRAAKIGAINVSLSPKASMAEFHAAKREGAMKFLEFFCKRAERGLEILKFLSVSNFGLQGAAVKRRSEILKFITAESLKSRFEPQKQAAGLLKLASEPPHNRSKILNFMPKPRDRFRILQPTYALVCLAGAVRNFISQHRFRILKFVPGRVHYTYIAQNFASQCKFKILKLICEPPYALRDALTRALLRCTSLRADKAEAGRAVRLTSQHTYDAVEKLRAVKFNHASGYLNSARCRIARLCSAAVRHGYKMARAENFSKFDLTGALLNFKSCFAMQLCGAVTRRNYEAWHSEIYAVCLHKYPALVRAASGKISRYEVGRATNALLSRGVQRMKFYALNRHAMKFLKFLGASRFGSQTASWFLKFKPEPSRNISEILNFTPELRKFKPMPAVRLNFALNSASQARAAKFENGVKFKRGAR